MSEFDGEKFMNNLLGVRLDFEQRQNVEKLALVLQDNFNDDEIAHALIVMNSWLCD